MKKLIILSSLILLPASAFGACEEYTAGHWYPGSYASQSLAVADVQSCHDDAGFDPGDTIHLKAGSATWAAQLEITKGCNIIGSGSDQTLITGNYTQSGYGETTDFLIAYVPGSGNRADGFRLSAISLDMDSKCQGFTVRNVSNSPVSNPALNVRVDHCIIQNPLQYNIYIRGSAYGVADNNTLIHNGANSVNFTGLQSTTWTLDDWDFGSANNFYLEDNNFNSNSGEAGQHVDSDSGGRYAVRYNTFNNASSGGSKPAINFHGSQGSDSYSSVLAEVYGNTFVGSGSVSSWIFSQRGGRVIMFDNNATTGNWFGVGEVHDYGANYVTVNGCDNLLTYPISSINGEPNYPHNSYYFNNQYNGVAQYLSQYANSRDGEHAYYIQDWLNYAEDCTISDYFPILCCSETDFGPARNVPLKNVDVWFQETAPASFDGTEGVGVGLWAARPGTCTDGTGYWATDKGGNWYTTNVGTNDGALYVCAGGDFTDVTDLYYTPYTYPHPLRGEGGSTPTASGITFQGVQIQ